MPKVLWKVTAVYQALIRRTVEIADGLRTAWNAGNLVTTITMARSLIETGAIVRHLTERIKEAVEKKDVSALDEAVMQVGFATRDENFIKDGAYKATNILTLIDRADVSMFKDKAPFRQSYDFLSEFAHPNHGGVLSLYSDNFPDEYRIEFGNTAKKKADILPQIRVPLAVIWLMEIAAKEIDEMRLAMLEFLPK